jgi:arylsulfatase A-like enzyme
MNTRRKFLGGIGGTLGAAAYAQSAARKPNLVVIFADDMGYGDIGCYGSPDVPTPHIDRLAREGTRFTDGYVSCAVCSPSRAALLTGQYQQRHGHEFNSGTIAREAEVNFGLPSSAKILPQRLAPMGYRSKAVGKWHLGARPGYHPLDRGFDEFYGFLGGGNEFITDRTPGAVTLADPDPENKLQPRRDPILRDREKLSEDRYLTDAFADESVEFVRANASRPFFLYSAFNAIHTPLHVTKPYVDRVAKIANERHRLLAAMTVALDDAVGRIVSQVRESQIEPDTMIVFLSDNGCPEITGAGTNGPLNGEKVTYFEGGIRVPYIMRWPGRIPAGKTYREPVVSRDIVPTFLSAAGGASDDFDGVDLLPYLNGSKRGAPHDFLFWRGGTGRAVRMGRWKLVEFGDNVRLFDLAADLGEKSDVATKNPNVVREMRGAFASWSAKMAPPAWPPRYRELTVNGEKWNWEL